MIDGYVIASAGIKPLWPGAGVGWIVASDKMQNKKISVIENILPYKKGLIFDNSEYKLNIRTSMRSRNKATEIERLDGIVNFGLLID